MRLQNLHRLPGIFVDRVQKPRPAKLGIVDDRLCGDVTKPRIHPNLDFLRRGIGLRRLGPRWRLRGVGRSAMFPEIGTTFQSPQAAAQR